MTQKAELVYREIKRRGGGVLEEYAVRTRCGISHGSFSAARKELVDAGLLQLGKEGRKTVYILPAQPQAAAAEAAPSAESAESGPKDCPEIPSKQTEAACPVEGAGENRPIQPEKQKAAVEVQAKPMIEQLPIRVRVSGHFADLDDWTDALVDELGSDVSLMCSDMGGQIAASVSSDGGERTDFYTVREMADGIEVE